MAQDGVETDDANQEQNTKTIQVVLHSIDQDRLSELKRLTGRKSTSSLFRGTLELAYTIAKLQAEGASIYLETESTTEKIRIIGLFK